MTCGYSYPYDGCPIYFKQWKWSTPSSPTWLIQPQTNQERLNRQRTEEWHSGWHEIIFSTLLSILTIICQPGKLQWLLPRRLTFVLPAENDLVAAAGWQIALHLNRFSESHCYMLSSSLVNWNRAHPQRETDRRPTRDTGEGGKPQKTLGMRERHSWTMTVTMNTG